MQLPEQYKYSSAKFYDDGKGEYSFLTHWMALKNQVRGPKLMLVNAGPQNHPHEHQTSAAGFCFIKFKLQQADQQRLKYRWLQPGRTKRFISSRHKNEVYLY
ncbi:MAG: hypothetical protein ABI472_23780 [Ginsengibacter sp.]